MESVKNKKGTTLIEILVVVAALIILAAIVAGVSTGVDNQSKERGVKATFVVLEAALQEYFDFSGVYPVAMDIDPRVNCEILYAALNSLPASRKVLEGISDKLIANKFNPLAVPAVQEIYDPWGTVINYQYNAGDAFVKLTSAGPDKKHGRIDPAAPIVDRADAADNITNR